MMKPTILTLLAVIALAAGEKYTTKYDGVNVGQILKSDRLFIAYFDCLMDNGRCTPDVSELKRVLPDALKTNCSKCSPTQRARTDEVFTYLIKNRKEHWSKLQKKYDPDDTYLKKYRAEAKKRGLDI